MSAVEREELAATPALAKLLHVGDVPLRRTLKTGARGNDVLAVRRALSHAGLIRWPEGGFTRPWHRVYGPVMVRAVRAFQQAGGVGVDGRYGGDTHKKLLPHFDSFGAMMMRSFHPEPEGNVSKTSTADRADATTRQEVIDFLRVVSRIWGHPILITTGTNHSKMTASGNISEHWTGRAADIAERGDDLTRLGQAALIAAGWTPAKAQGTFGGLFNVHRGSLRYQIIFQTHEGGDHTDHLHVGIRGI